MVGPGTTLPGTADDTIDTTTPAASPPSSGKGWSSYSNNKKLAIGGGGGVVIGIVLYIIIKRKNASAAASVAPTPGAGNTAPMYVLPSSNQDAVQGANDAALNTALGSIGQQLTTIGNEVNNQPPTNVTTKSTVTYGTCPDCVTFGSAPPPGYGYTYANGQWGLTQGAGVGLNTPPTSSTGTHPIRTNPGGMEQLPLSVQQSIIKDTSGKQQRIPL